MLIEKQGDSNVGSRKSINMHTDSSETHDGSVCSEKLLVTLAEAMVGQPTMSVFTTQLALGALGDCVVRARQWERWKRKGGAIVGNNGPIPWRERHQCGRHLLWSWKPMVDFPVVDNNRSREGANISSNLGGNTSGYVGRVSSDILEKLINRMSRICEALIKAKGRFFEEN
ncbi:uncharacterized protein LOC129807859 [Phlebotomus papatasi]|uniref:uncharacterized protein LOC129807859 n=1 Tax=Phlebotomus papatasi TaxID=29031 RepID=UPI002483DE60|nr:uncharacterized protein LOC129807859 [Phlebotomus papatasi]